MSSKPAESVTSQASGAPLGRKGPQKSAESYSTNKNTRRNQKYFANMSPMRKLIDAAVKANKQAVRQCISRLHETPAWKEATQEIRVELEKAAKEAAMHKRDLNGQSYAAKVAKKDQLISRYTPPQVRNAEMNFHCTTAELLRSQQEMVNAWLKSQDPTDSKEYINVEHDEPRGTTVEEFEQDEKPDITYAIPDESKEAMFFDDDDARYKYLDSQAQTVQTVKVNKVRETMWLSLATYWFVAMQSMIAKLGLLAEKFDSFKGTYEEIMASGILEEVVNCNPTTAHYFQQYLLEPRIMVEEYQVESWEEYEPLDAEVKTIYSKIDLSDGAHSNINMIDILDIPTGLSGVDTLNQTQPDVDITGTWMTYVTEHDKHGYRRVPGFFIPIDCLFTRAEMSVLCNLASHSDDIDLEELCVWPPYLNLKASGIILNTNRDSSLRAWNLTAKCEVIDNTDSGRVLKAVPGHEVTEEMLWLSRDSAIFDLVPSMLELAPLQKIGVDEGKGKENAEV